MTLLCFSHPTFVAYSTELPWVNSSRDSCPSPIKMNRCPIQCPLVSFCHMELAYLCFTWDNVIFTIASPGGQSLCSFTAIKFTWGGIRNPSSADSRGVVARGNSTTIRAPAPQRGPPGSWCVKTPLHRWAFNITVSESTILPSHCFSWWCGIHFHCFRFTFVLLFYCKLPGAEV